MNHCNEKLVREVGLILYHIVSTDPVYNSVNEIQDWKSDRFKTDEVNKRSIPN